MTSSTRNQLKVDCPMQPIEDWLPHATSQRLITLFAFYHLETIFTVFGNLLKRRCSLKIILKFSGMVYDSVFKVQILLLFFFFSDSLYSLACLEKFVNNFFYYFFLPFFKRQLVYNTTLFFLCQQVFYFFFNFLQKHIFYKPIKQSSIFK